jgi:glucan 1,3-beta-glucosidase
VNDCGLFLNGVGLGTRFEGDYTPGNFPRVGDCEPYLDWQSWTEPLKATYKQLALSSMDALQVGRV